MKGDVALISVCQLRQELDQLGYESDGALDRYLPRGISNEAEVFLQHTAMGYRLCSGVESQYRQARPRRYRGVTDFAMAAAHYLKLPRRPMPGGAA